MASQTTDDLVQASIPPTRAVNTTVPLTGGGALSEDRTIAISDVVGDAGAGGVKGAVPAPAAGDTVAQKYLGAAGTWSKVVPNVLGAHGESFTFAQVSEEITLSTTGATTDSSANILPAGAVILAVVARVTTTIETATDWSLGDDATAARFLAADSTLTADHTAVGLAHLQGGVSTDATGPVQTSAAKLRITTSGTPTAGKIRVTVFYGVAIAPLS